MHTTGPGDKRHSVPLVLSLLKPAGKLLFGTALRKFWLHLHEARAAGLTPGFGCLGSFLTLPHKRLQKHGAKGM